MDSHSIYSNSSKHLKEEFVSNLNGSSMLEIFALFTIYPALAVICHSLGVFSLTGNDEVKSFSRREIQIGGWKNLGAYAASVLVDFLFLILPILLIITVVAQQKYALAVLLNLLLLLLLAIFFIRYDRSSYARSRNLRAHISSYRVLMMIMTCICILAVDFKIFPRRYAKTETYGTSLMDLGVGSFVVVNALVSRQARNAASMNLASVLRSTSPLIFCGICRLMFTAGMDYQVHVGEYGVHWNFFFTLAAISILTTLFKVPARYSGFFGLLLLTGYQGSLIYGLNGYLLSSERTSYIISQNKEGIFSIFGYWGMYLVSVQLSYFSLYGGRSSKEQPIIRVCFLTLSLWLLTLLLDWHVEKVSRRMCNMSYVTLVLAVNFQGLALVMLSDYIPRVGKPFLLRKAYDRNLLGIFLAANILTGLVNMSVDTLSASPPKSLIILLAYMLSLTTIAGLADFCNIRLKV